MEATVNFQKTKIRDVSPYDEQITFERVLEVENESKIQLHPCYGSETIAILTDSIPENTNEIKALVCTENDEASAVEYAMTVIEADDDELARKAISEPQSALSHSEWHRVEKNQIYELKVEIPFTENNRYLVLATRIPSDGRQRNAWARWLEFRFTDNSFVYSTVKLSNVKTSLQCISGEIISSSYSSPPFGLVGKIAVVGNRKKRKIPIVFKRVEQTHGYSPQKYIFTLKIPVEFQQQTNEIICNIYSIYEQKIIYESLINTNYLKEPYGFIDGVSDNCIWGWAWNPQFPDKSLIIDIVFNNKSQNTSTQIIANRYRQDLYQSGFGNGCYGFEIYFSNPLDKFLIKEILIEDNYQIKNIGKIKEKKQTLFKLPKIKLNASDRITLR